MGGPKDDAGETTPLLANTDNASSSTGTSTPSSPIDVDDAASATSTSLDGDVPAADDDNEPVGWLSLPKKKQLILLALCRLSEPISSTSLLSYVYYFIKSLPGADTPQQISRRAGMMVAAFSLCQFVTGMIWGRVSDIYGRKPVIVAGLLGSMLASLGLAFSTSYRWAVCMRMMSGGSNATTGVLRTIVAELIKEKRYQGRAFLIMPMCMNIGIIIGPMLGGILANPIESHPDIFGPGSWLGGEHGVGWMKKYPYALPQLVSAVFLCLSCLLATFGLEETNPSGDILKLLKSKLSRAFATLTHPFRRSSHQPLPSNDTDTDIITPHNTTSQPRAVPLKDVLTPSVTLCLLCFIVLPLHNSTFMQLYPIFLSTPRADNSHPKSPLTFTGGLGLPASQVGSAMAILGFIGITMQLFIYPPLQTRLGTLRSYRLSLLLFPIAYLFTPFLAVLPSDSRDISEPASGVAVWSGIVAALFVQVTARTFAGPGNVILLINSVDNRRALGTVNGLGASLSSLARAVGPLSAGWGYGLALEEGVVGAVWWAMAVVAMGGVFVSSYITEGEGFAHKEEEEEEEEAEAVKDPEPTRRDRV
ncbi:Major facilitator superfamily multidrug transporter [Drechslerella dactyloides]|uniref:Major facilitator superfamily multidrug transporter n=1 Tax=Drechslerella dactyloides TaxID=74499 RepID=A0AAD6IWQ3_DREDA|nr:Major facilitator superfamily multidrug transporter [Drechslerella dactyloides]